MKIKKSTIDQLVKEELSAMLKKGLITEVDWSRFKQQVARGFAETGDQDAWYAKFARGIGLDGEQKAALAALDELAKALEQVSKTKAGSAAGGGESKTAQMICGGAFTLSVQSLHQIVDKLREDMTTLFSEVGAGAPAGAPDAEPEEEEDPVTRRSRRIEMDENVNRKLRKQIRQKLRRFTS